MADLPGLRIPPLIEFSGDLPDIGPVTVGVTHWKDARDRVVGRSMTTGGYHWIWVRKVGMFRLLAAADPMIDLLAEVQPEPDVPEAVVEDFYLRTVLPIALQAYGFEALHASAVELYGEGVVALCGPSESGKSTLAYALARRGHRQISDDTLTFEPRSMQALPLPSAARLRPESAEHYGTALKNAVLVSREGWDAAASSPRPFVAAVFLRRGGTGQAELRRIRGSDALKALLAEAYVFSLFDMKRKSIMVRYYLEMSHRLPVYELTYPDGLEHAPAACHVIESLGVELP